MKAQHRYLVGIYPGSFDPITKGHMDIIRRALRVVDKLIVAVAADTTNKKPVFSVEERAEMVRENIKELNSHGNLRVEAQPFHGLLVNFAKEHQCAVLIRGVRAVSDFEYEFQMFSMNTKLEPSIETIFLPASDTTQFIASRFVKEIARLGGDVSELVSPEVEKRLKEHFKKS